MKDILFKNWHVMRIIRLVLSVILLVEAVQMKEPLLGAFGGIFLLMTLFNAGCGTASCCGTNDNCNTTPAKQNTKKEIEFEEVK